ncbi:unnamed protein product [Prunus armeniaca]
MDTIGISDVGMTECRRQRNQPPPPVGKYKLNADAAFIPETCVDGIGAVFRNDKGEVMVAMALPLETATSPKHA